MRLPRYMVLAILFVGLWQGLTASASAQGAPQSYIVVLEDSIAPEAVPSIAQELALGHGLALGHVYNVALKGFSAEIPAARLDVLRLDPRVNNIVEDKVLTASCHANTFQTLPTGVNRVQADQSLTADIDTLDDQRVNADIAILDTGIYGKHADLNVYKAVDCAGKGGCKVITNPLNAKDPNGHGTHVAGSAAAIDNTKYVVGVAPGARLWSVRVLGSGGTGLTSWVIAGINYVTSRAGEIEVANMSLGGPGSDTGNCGVNASGTVVDPLHKAICSSVGAGVVYTVAAGNDSQDATNSTPAAYDEVITVSALDDSSDTFASFSNYGTDVDLIAPGVNILSTFPGDRASPGGYCAEASGTSMATPHVAGGAALYLATHSKPIDRAGTEAVRDALRAAGECPSGASKDLSNNCTAVWPGDPDGNGEPLLNVGGF